MRLICPECGAFGSISQFATDNDARVVAELLARAPADIGISMLNYVSLFRPAKRVLTWPRARRLLVDLEELMRSGCIHRRGQDLGVTRTMWRQALEQMTDARPRLTLPLKSHGYLLEIVAGLADKAAASVEDKREAELRAGLKAGKQAPERISRQQRIDNAVAGENAARKRIKLPPLTAAEIPDFLNREGIT